MYKGTETAVFFSVPVEKLHEIIHDAVKSAIATHQQPTTPESDFLSVSEVAELLRLKPISVYRYVKAGMPHIRGKKNMLFKRTDVMQWVETTLPNYNPATAAKIAANLKKKGGK